MKINRRVLFINLLFIGVIALLLISTYLYITDANNKKKTVQISVIVYGDNTDRWATLRQGIDQGAADAGYQVNFVTMASDSDPDEQIKLINREIANGTDGIIIAAVDSKAMAGVIDEISISLPVVMVETGVDYPKRLCYVSADNYSMGLNVGRSVILNNRQKNKIAVLMENHQRNSVVERFNGFMDSLKYSSLTIEVWERDERGEDLSLFIRNNMEKRGADIIVALDNSTLETLVDSMLTHEFDAHIYGIGNSNKVIHYLDYGLINSIVYQNEFNMGYFSVQRLFDCNGKNGGKLETEIEFRTINRETMYLPKNQRLVFPIIQ